jgi:hypothetical protein
MFLPRFLDQLALRLLRSSKYGGALALARRSSLGDQGWFVAYQRNMSVDRQGNPVPWIPYPARTLIESRLSGSMRVFEYGAGASTLWWPSRVGSVTSVEHDPAWVTQVRARAPANVTVILCPLDPAQRYAETAVAEGGGFQVLFIDGRHRNLCMHVAPDAVSDDGVVILDNSERSEYSAGISALESRGFRRLAIAGLAPGLLEESETSVFYRDRNVFGL